jgi:hypothetical protein
MNGGVLWVGRSSSSSIGVCFKRYGISSCLLCRLSLAALSEVLFQIYIYMPPLLEQHIFQMNMENQALTGFERLKDH